MEFINDFFRGYLLLFIIFVSLERCYTLNRKQKIFRPGWLTDFLYFLSNKIVNEFGLFMVGVVISYLAVFREASEGSISFVQGYSASVQFFCILILAEIGGYFIHRMFHAIPALWQFHKIHHSSEKLDWMVSMRLHFVDYIFLKSFQIVPAYLLGFDIQLLALFGVFSTFCGMFQHSNLKLTFPGIRWIISTPEFHHWHHTAEKSEFNQNFAGYLPIADYLMGTLRPFDAKRTTQFGLSETIPKNFFGQLLFPFKEIMKSILKKRRYSRAQH